MALTTTICTGNCTELSIDFETNTLEATMLFPVTDSAYNIAALVHRLVDGIEVIVGQEEDE
jgi:hypothetical protein